MQKHVASLRQDDLCAGQAYNYVFAQRFATMEDTMS